MKNDEFWTSMKSNVRKQYYENRELKLAEILANEIQKEIDNGKFKTGDKLPTVRELAVLLDIGVTTVSQGYKILIERGCCESHRRHGICVSSKEIQNDTKNNAEHLIELFKTCEKSQGIDLTSFYEMVLERPDFQTMMEQRYNLLDRTNEKLKGE